MRESCGSVYNLTASTMRNNNTRGQWHFTNVINPNNEHISKKKKQ